MSGVEPDRICGHRTNRGAQNCGEQVDVSVGGQSAGSQEKWRSRKRHSILFHEDDEENNQLAVRNEELTGWGHRFLVRPRLWLGTGLFIALRTANAQAVSQAVEISSQPGRRLQFDCL